MPRTTRSSSPAGLTRGDQFAGSRHHTDPSAPTILTSRPEGKRGSKAVQDCPPCTPHGQCNLCRYRVFSRLEDSPCLGHGFDDLARTKHRTAITSEAVSEDDTGIQVHPKCEKSRRLILDALIAAGPPLKEWCEDLDRDILQQVISASCAWKASRGDEIILQGEQLDDSAPGLYIVESGELHAYRRRQGDGPPGTLVREYTRTGDTFGELAVLYCAPRAATVIAARDSYLWSIDRHTMTSLKRQCMEARRALYDGLLRHVPLLAPLRRDERAQLVDSLKPAFFEEGEVIIGQGDEGREFFILEEGKARVEKDGRVVSTYGKGCYFGELALLSGEPRAASVVAASHCKCAVLDRECFHRLLGPLESLRGRTAACYEDLKPAFRGGSQDQTPALGRMSQAHKPSCSTRRASRMTVEFENDADEPSEISARPSRRPSRMTVEFEVAKEELMEEPLSCHSSEHHDDPRHSVADPPLTRPSRVSNSTALLDTIPEADNQPPRRSANHMPEADYQPPRRSANHVPEADYQPPRRSANHMQEADYQPPRRSANHMPEVDCQPPRRSANHMPEAHYQPPRRSAKATPEADFQPPRRSATPTPAPTGVRGRTPPPVDYNPAPEDRLCYDSDEDLSNLFAQRQMAEATSPSGRRTSSRSSQWGPAAKMKSFMKKWRKGSESEEASSAMLDTAAPFSL